MDTSRTCANCTFSFAGSNGGMHCRRFPPQVVAIIGEREESVVDKKKYDLSLKAYQKELAAWNKATSKRLLPPQPPEPRMHQTLEMRIGLLGYASNFPKVEPTWSCGEISVVIKSQSGTSIPIIGGQP